MRRLPLAIAALAGAALLAGCGAGHAKPTSTQGQTALRPHGHLFAVDVFFCTHLLCAAGATQREENLVGERLRREPCVRRVVFIPKAEALAKLKKEHPKLVAAMPPGLGNPLPDAFQVTPDKLACLSAIAAAARAAHWPGVQQVELARRHQPATPAGS